MEKKLLKIPEDLVLLKSEESYGSWDFWAGFREPKEYPCILVYEFHYNSSGPDYYTHTYLYPSDFT